MNKYEVLKSVYGYDTFRDGQEEVIDALLSNRDLIGVMPTGFGKSVSFQIPALMKSGLTIIISPLISLMKDQVMALKDNNVLSAFLNSSMSFDELKDVMNSIRLNKYKIIYVAPERLKNNYFLDVIKSKNVEMIIIDEAHCISQWGPDFRPSYLQIAQFIESFQNRPVVAAFTATATKAVEEDIHSILGLNNPVVFKKGFDRKNLFFSVIREVYREDYILDYIKNHKNESGIIYCNTRQNVEDLYELLKKNNITTCKYHAGLSKEERDINQEDFIYDNKQIIVATNAFGMGIDKSNVRFVIHYNMPKDIESYYQEAGRAGRDGLDSECILLYSSNDVRVNRFLIENPRQIDAVIDDVQIIKERAISRLNTMQQYAYTKDCLRKYILDYFGDYSVYSCDNCSNCLQSYQEIDVTEDANIIIKMIFEYNNRYGMTMFLDTLHGSNNKKVIDSRLIDTIYHGKLKHVEMKKLQDLMRQLISEGYILVSNGKFPTLSITDKGNNTLNNHSNRISMKVSKDIPSKSKENKIKHEISDYKLYDELRQLRLELSKEAHMPPYIIYSDRTLIELTNLRPRNIEMLLNVNGIGNQKAEQYGEKILAVISKYIKNIENTDLVHEQEEQSSKNEKNDNLDLFNALRTLRLKIAKEEKVSAFVVFPNTVLTQLVDIKPKTIEELLEIKGFGKNRVAKYGQIILNEITKYMSDQNTKPTIHKEQIEKLSEDLKIEETVDDIQTVFQNIQSIEKAKPINDRNKEENTPEVKSIIKVMPKQSFYRKMKNLFRIKR